MNTKRYDTDESEAMDPWDYDALGGDCQGYPRPWWIGTVADGDEAVETIRLNDVRPVGEINGEGGHDAA